MWKPLLMYNKMKSFKVKGEEPIYNTMKKMMLGAMLLGTFIVAPLSNLKAEERLNSEKKIESNTEDRYVKRLKEIRAMDIKHMSSAQKKELRKEVLGMKKDLKQREPVVIISVGTLLLIVLLVLLLA